MLIELGFEATLPTTLHVNNKAPVENAHSEKLSKKSRFMAMRLLWLREMVRNSLVRQTRRHRRQSHRNLHENPTSPQAQHLPCNSHGRRIRTGHLLSIRHVALCCHIILVPLPCLCRLLDAMMGGVQPHGYFLPLWVFSPVRPPLCVALYDDTNWTRIRTIHQPTVHRFPIAHRASRILLLEHFQKLPQHHNSIIHHSQLVLS